MITVILCDDHRIVRDGVRRILESSGQIKVAAEADSSEALLKVLKTTRAEVLLLDISLGDTNGMDLLTRIKQLYPEQKVVMVSMVPESQMASRAARSGASGYVSKDSPVQALVDAVLTVGNGRIYFSEDTMREISGTKRNASALPHLDLSDREMQVMMLIGRGVGIKEIANALNLSSKTVSTYKLRILEKMNFSSTADIVKYVLQQQL